MDHSSNIPIDSLGDILESAPAFSTPDEHSPSTVPSEAQFYRRIEGKEIGPYSIAELQALIDRDQLHKPDRIRRSDSKCWVPCQELPELVFRMVDVAHEKEIKAASSLLNEMFSDDEVPVASPDLLAIEDLPEIESSRSSEAAHHRGMPSVNRAPPNPKRPKPVSNKPSARDRKRQKQALPDPSTLAASAPVLEPVAPHVPEPVAPGTPTSETESAIQATVETQFDIPATPTQIAPPPHWNSPTPLPSSSKSTPKSTPKPKRERKAKSGRGFSLPSARLISGLIGLVTIVAVYRFWPESSRGMQGTIAVDGKPLTVGSLSLTTAGTKDGKAMSFSVVEGRFRSAEKLPDGGYDAVVVVGSPLGMPVSQLENTPFQSLNGARFKFQVKVGSETPVMQMDLSANEAVPLKGSGGGADGPSSK